VIWKYVKNVIIDQVEWDADYYGRHIPMKGVGEKKEEHLQKRYPSKVKKVNMDINTGHNARHNAGHNAGHNADADTDVRTSINRPCIIIDIHRRILCWYLPGVLSDGFQVCFT
jgi:hypothetical protein